MLLTRTFVNVCNTVSVASVSGKVLKPNPKILFPHLSLCKNQLVEARRGCAAESAPQDLVVDHLEGENSGVIVFGLNRPKVSIYYTNYY